MTWIPYELELRDYQDLPESLRVDIDKSRWEQSDELERECILLDLGVKPRADRE